MIEGGPYQQAGAAKRSEIISTSKPIKETKESEMKELIGWIKAD